MTEWDFTADPTSAKAVALRRARVERSLAARAAFAALWRMASGARRPALPARPLHRHPLATC